MCRYSQPDGILTAPEPFHEPEELDFPASIMNKFPESLLRFNFAAHLSEHFKQHLQSFNIDEAATAIVESVEYLLEVAEGVEPNAQQVSH